MELIFDRPKNAGGVITLSASERIPGLEEYLRHEDTRAGLVHYATRTVVDDEFVLAIESLRVDGALPLPEVKLEEVTWKGGSLWVVTCAEPLALFFSEAVHEYTPQRFVYFGGEYGNAKLTRDVVLTGWGQELPA